MKRLCSSAELPLGGSIRFPLDPQGPLDAAAFGLRPSPAKPAPPFAEEGFAHRAPDGTVRAWVNVCPHRAQPIDLGDGRLFNAAGEIECQAHGARFDPATGNCRGGPCTGNELRPLAIEEVEGEIRAATEAA